MQMAAEVMESYEGNTDGFAQWVDLPRIWRGKNLDRPSGVGPTVREVELAATDEQADFILSAISEQ